MKATDFIAKMVEETLSLDNSGESNKLNFDESECFEVKAIYLDEKQCFVMRAHNQELEIPKNWGPFKNRISNEFTLFSSDDNDHFLAVASVFFNRSIECLKIQLVNSEFNIPGQEPNAA